MTDEENANLRRLVARLEAQVARCEAQIKVHPEQFDDKKKGPSCRNWIARATFKKERDRHTQELVELRTRLEAALSAPPTAAPPTAVLDFVI